jgi:Tol biopolymer transport system component
MHRRFLALCAVVALIGPTASTTESLDAQTEQTCMMLGWTGFSPYDGVAPLNKGTVENVDGTPVRSLDGVTGFGWSPNGASLAWSEQEFDVGTLQIGDSTGSSSELTLPGAGGAHVEWSPAGDRLLSADSFGVRIVEASGVVTDVWPDGRRASWSSDGEWITWTTDAGVLVARADGSGVQVAAGSPFNGSTWRPTTHQLLVLAPSMMLYDADTGALTPFTVTPLDFAEGFVWSPDGEALAWSASPDGVQSPRIYVERFDGSPAEAISPAIPQTGDPAAARPFESPAWSPDGTTIVAAEFDGAWSTGIAFGRPNLRLLASAGAGAGTPIGSIGPEIPPAALVRVHSTLWSPDSRWLLVQVEAGFSVGGFVTGYSGHVVPVDGSSPPRQVGSSLRVVGQMAWWPVVGVPGAGGACVLPAAVEPTPEVQPSTRPQFTG